MKKTILEQLQGGLIVSCQTQKDEPIYTPDMVVKMAECAKWGGAVGLRINSPEQIRQVKEANIGLPIIGLFKVWHDDTDVFITPTMKEVDAIVQAGADIIALDCTAQITHEKTIAWDLLAEVRKKYPDHLILADVSNIEEAIHAYKNGAELVAPTLYGYTKETKHIEGANFRMVAQMCRELAGKAHVIMEGHIYTPEEAMQCLYLGCHSVVVGSAITRPHYVTKRFVDCIGKYQDNWRDAERAKHANELK